VVLPRDIYGRTRRMAAKLLFWRRFHKMLRNLVLSLLAIVDLKPRGRTGRPSHSHLEAPKMVRRRLDLHSFFVVIQYSKHGQDPLPITRYLPIPMQFPLPLKNELLHEGDLANSQDLLLLSQLAMFLLLLK